MAVSVILRIGERTPPVPQALVAGDTAAILQYALTTPDGETIPVDSGATVLFKLRKRGAGSAAVNAAGTVAYGALGLVQFAFSGGTPVPAAGDYDASFTVDGITYPLVTHGYFLPINIEAALA